MTTIAVCTDRDAADDRGSWSGTPANLIDALRGLGVEVVPLGPLGSWRRWTLQRWSGVTGRLGRRVNWEVEPVAARFMGRQLAKALRGRQVDAVVTMGWFPILPSGVDLPPVWYYGDAAAADRIDHSPFWSGIAARTRRQSVPTERAALSTLAGAFMSSQWAVDGLVRAGSIERERVHHVPFGANVRDPGPIERRRPTTTLRLLAVGVQWQRKGLDKAVLATDELRARGLDASLDVVGSDPPDESWLRPHVRYHGFVDTRSATGIQELDSLYRRADFFVLPTQYDPFCIAISEAHAYSLPVAVSAVDGITERITDQGVLYAGDATPADIADAIEGALPAYDAMCVAGRETALREANWTHAAQLILDHTGLGR